MPNKYEYTVSFEVPDEVGEENVLLVLREFFGDLIQTDRFIDARVEMGVDETMNDGEVERVREMVSDVSEDELIAAINVATRLQQAE